MPARSRKQARTVAELPDLPADVDTADGSLTLPERVYDLQLVESVWREVDASARVFSGFTCRDVRFERCDFSGAVLDGAALTRVHFLDCRLTGVVLSGTELNDVVIDGGVANLANFRGSTSSFLCARNTSLRGADLYAARVRNGALLDCDLTELDVTDARIEGLSVHGSRLESIRGVAALVDAALSISADQVVPLGVALVAGLGVAIGPRPSEP